MLNGNERSELSEGRKFTQCSDGKTQLSIKLAVGKQFGGLRTGLFTFLPHISGSTTSLVMTVVTATGHRVLTACQVLVV